jgi:hypothetical protein
MLNWRAHNTVLLGLVVGLTFGAANLLVTWLDPLADDAPGTLLLFYGPMFFVWAAASFREAQRSGQVSAGLRTGAIVALATFFAYDLLIFLRVNLFLNELTGRADWQDMMRRFRVSGFDSLREFVNVDYTMGIPLKLSVSCLIGLMMGAGGGILGRLRNRSRVTTSTALALILCAPSSLRSQGGASNVFTPLTTDSTAWQRVVVYAVSALSSQLVASASDPTAQPWQLQLPSNEPQEQLIKMQLRTILRIRQAMPADTLVRSLEFGPLVISNDTARVQVRFEETRKCPQTGKTTGSGWATTVLVPREPRQKFWGSAFSRTTIVGDRLPC